MTDRYMKYSPSIKKKDITSQAEALKYKQHTTAGMGSMCGTVVRACMKI